MRKNRIFVFFNAASEHARLSVQESVFLYQLPLPLHPLSSGEKVPGKVHPGSDWQRWAGEAGPAAEGVREAVCGERPFLGGLAGALPPVRRRGGAAVLEAGPGWGLRGCAAAEHGGR